MESFLLRYLLLALLSCLVFSTVPASGDLVLDTNGNPVISGVPYYIRAAQVRGDGNLGWVSQNGSCPLNVFLRSFPYGPPVMFFPEEVSPRQNKSVLLLEKLSIMFAAPSPCDASTLWKLDRSTGFVTTGGVAPLPSETSQSRFRIDRYPYPGVNVYQFMYCPDDRMLCITVGLVKGTMLLGESTDLMALRFIRVTEDNKGSSFKRA